EVLKIKLRELESNLENKTVRYNLNDNKFDLDRFIITLDKYIHNLEKVDPKFLKIIEEKVNELVSYSNEMHFDNYSHKFINNARFLIKNIPSFETKSNEDISEEEFVSRCEKLLEKLSYEHEIPNLILKTFADKKEFKVFINKNNSFIYFAENSEKGMSTSLNNLIDIAFNRKESHRKSYDNVLISKIIDKTVFQEIDNTFDDELNESLINQIRKHSEELFKLKDDLETMQKNENDLNTKKFELEAILAESKTIKEQYNNAKDAAINDSKLKASIDYWDDKHDKHKKQFYIYSIGAIFLILTLIYILFNSDFIHQETNQKAQKIAIINDNNQSNVKADVTVLKKVDETTSKQINTSQTDLEKESLLLDKIDSFALYALLIFASSSALWIIRIIVKIALSNLHLSEDANERVVMIKTYLSFMQEGNSLDTNDKELILSSIFRPSIIGIIKDESSITVADIISSLKK
ncbi:DUF6161 domain-containing protein, partial [Poseidonibacter sp.]|uniref:DUF6161 domain-containing protein n=1 Tax=Poseidonibacter sp. TaxID=2321188 RepID=UPI003C7260B5